MNLKNTNVKLNFFSLHPTRSNNYEGEIKALSDYISKFFIEVRELSYIRDGSHYALLLNHEYVVRISRLSDFNYESDFVANTESIEIRNKKYKKEISVTNDIFKKMSELTFPCEYNFSPNYIYTGMYEQSLVGIYKIVEGEVFDPKKMKSMQQNGLFLTESFAIDFSDFLSNLHRLSPFECGYLGNLKFEKESGFNYEKKPRTVYRTEQCIKYIESEDDGQYLNFIFSKTKDELISKCYKTKEFFEVSSEREGFCMLHNAIEYSHVLVCNETFSGMIDWEHMHYSQNGWMDISDFLFNFIFGCDDVDISNDVWDTFCENYYCSHKGRTLHSEELHHITILALMKYYVKFVTNMQKEPPSKNFKAELESSLIRVMHRGGNYGF